MTLAFPTGSQAPPAGLDRFPPHRRSAPACQGLSGPDRGSSLTSPRTAAATTMRSSRSRAGFWFGFLPQEVTGTVEW